MGDGVRGPDKKVAPITSLQAWVRERDRAEEAPPTSLEAAAARLAEMSASSGELGINRWRDPMVMPDVNIAAIGGDGRTRFSTGADDDLAAERLARAEVRYFEGLNDLEGLVNDSYGLLIRHCAYMCGMQRREDMLHGAYFKGELAPAFFRRNITESPYEEALIARLDILQMGFYSDDPVTRRDTLVLSCDIVKGLWYAAEDERVRAHAIFARAAAMDYLETTFELADCAKVEMSLASMTSAVPAARYANATQTMVHGARVFAGRVVPLRV
jgi:hypothetical protein